jgi:mRNA interferase MazF
MAQKIERGQIWWINLDPTVGSQIRKTRPCVVFTANEANEHRRTPVVVPLSASPDEAFPYVVSVPSAGKDSVAVTDQIRAVDKRRFVRCSGRLKADDIGEIETALKLVLALS